MDYPQLVYGLCQITNFQEQYNFRSSYVMKARLHTWLSWQEEPGTPMGHAITKEYMSANAKHALNLIKLFRNVFELNSPERDVS